ncbi:ATP-binding protein [Planomonospora sp. ID67723]|nr:ATP-binding protein [Planomonospora sp. ID67723]
MVRRRLAVWGAGNLVDDCVLVVSELVTNAIRHGGAPCVLRLGGGEGHVYGELFDPGTGAPRMRETGPEATGGRGLRIVDALADDWGVTWPPSGGKAVWFVLGASVLGASVPSHRLQASPAAEHACRGLGA